MPEGPTFAALSHRRSLSPRLTAGGSLVLVNEEGTSLPRRVVHPQVLVIAQVTARSLLLTVRLASP